MLEVVELVAQGRPLVIEISPDNRRVVAELFEHPRGIVFADIGWDNPTQAGHPFHVIEGNFRKVGAKWLVGQAILSEMTEDDPLLWEFLEWRHYLEGRGAESATRDRAMEQITAQGLMEA